MFRVLNKITVDFFVDRKSDLLFDERSLNDYSLTDLYVVYIHTYVSHEHIDI